MGRTTGRTPRWTGVMGGSFDPVHLGHLQIARAVRRVFALDRVLLVPCAVPPHKHRDRVSETRHRVRMLRLATRGRAGLRVDTRELDRGGVSYTIDTLRDLRADPGAGAPLFVLGMDSLLDFPTWHEHRALVEEFDHVAVDRPGSDPGPGLEPWIAERVVPVPATGGAGAALLRGRSAPGGTIYRLTLEPIPISSRRIRRRVRRGEPLDGLVPPAVARYIQEERLYSREDAR